MLEVLKEIVLEAGELVRRGYHVVNEKGSASNVATDCDIAVEKFLIDNLSARFDDIGFLCEESGTGYNPLNHEYAAVIDPIDGTSNFVRDMRMSAISVALLRRGQPWLGVVYQPYTDELFAAEQGKGATLNGVPIHVSQRPLQRACLAVAWSLYDKTLADPCIAICRELYDRIDDFRRLGTAALELCYLACGRLELYFEIRLYPWDFAAGMLIIQEAGGVAEALLPGLDRPSAVLAANCRESYAVLKQTVDQHLPADIFQRKTYSPLF